VLQQENFVKQGAVGLASLKYQNSYNLLAIENVRNGLHEFGTTPPPLYKM